MQDVNERSNPDDDVCCKRKSPLDAVRIGYSMPNNQ